MAPGTWGQLVLVSPALQSLPEEPHGDARFDDDIKPLARGCRPLSISLHSSWGKIEAGRDHLDWGRVFSSPQVFAGRRAEIAEII